MKRTRHTIARVSLLALAIIGATLLLVNLIGYGGRYTVPAAAKRVPAASMAGIALHEPLTQRRGEPDRAYFARLVRDVHLRMAFYWSQRTDRVTFTDNWILALAGHFVTTYRRYEFVNPDRALRRGFGFCSQDANVVFGELQRSGFHPSTILLPAHTFVAVTDHDGNPFVLDGLYGVVIPHSYTSIRRAPQLVVPYYRQVTAAESPDAGYGISLARSMVSVYASPDATVNTGSATPHTAIIEPIAYVLKWLIPALLMGPVLLWLSWRLIRRLKNQRVRRADVPVPV